MPKMNYMATTIVAAFAIITAFVLPATAVTLDANGGVVVSHKTGATARVGVAYAARFQAYINDLEAHGARIAFMGGIRSGRCSASHEHPCGKALDVCQLGRGVVSRKCNLPGRREIAQIASAHGLTEGGIWCNSDYGHAQVGMTAGPCGSRQLMARRHSRSRLAVTYRPIQGTSKTLLASGMGNY